MKIITKLSILWFLLIGQLNHAQTDLCPSTATQFCCEYVASVTFNGVFFQGNNDFTGPGYYNYTNVPMPILQAGTTVPLSVVVTTNGPYQQFVKFWIDFNNNGNLEDPGELVYDETEMINSTTYTFTGNIAVPAHAFNGPVRMRLIMVYNNIPELCGDYAYGNTFDFGSSVQGGVNPVGLTVNRTGTGNVVSNPSGINTANNVNFSNFAENSLVTLTATPIAPQSFTGWSGAATGTTNPITVTMNQAKTITANFRAFTPPPTAPATQELCPGSTVANLQAAGSNLSWFTTATGGVALNNNTPLTTRNYFVSQTVSGTTSTRTAVAVTLLPILGSLSSISGISVLPSVTTVATYSVTPVAGVASYVWELPAGMTILSQTGPSITVNLSSTYTDGTLRVKAINTCNESPTRSLRVRRATPIPPGGFALAITGEIELCTNATQEYTATTVNNGTYLWTVPTGITVVSGQGTSSITVSSTSDFVSGQIRVSCSTATATQLASINVSGAPLPSVIAGPSTVCSLTQA
ncbi:GEVED domain-containing protein, partial [Flavobacterium cheonanense]|uniref:GEVED domain-containing protein n=1 Tax=Flavobacterium cheonanense TaxID=706183 RepID=UPI0031E30F79